MRLRSVRALAGPFLALALALAGCGQAEDQPGATPDAPSPGTGLDEVTRSTPAPQARTGSEQAFLDELAGLGLPTGMSADTTVEVGIGICQNIEDGVDTDTILDHIRPLSSAVATQTAEHGTDQVGRAIVEASRTHLCD